MERGVALVVLAGLLEAPPSSGLREGDAVPPAVGAGVVVPLLPTRSTATSAVRDRGAAP
jgi:hypothetical protein